MQSDKYQILTLPESCCPNVPLSPLYNYIPDEKSIQVFANQQKIILVQFQITLVVHVVVDLTFFGDVYGSKEVEIKVVVVQFHPRDFGFSRGIEFYQHLVIAPQAVIRIADELFSFHIQSIIISIPAIVIAKFLIASTEKLGTAFQTSAFFHACEVYSNYTKVIKSNKPPLLYLVGICNFAFPVTSYIQLTENHIQDALQPQRNRSQMAKILGGKRHFRSRCANGQTQVLRIGYVPVSFGSGASRRTSAGVYRFGHIRAVPATSRIQGIAPHGLRFFRTTGGAIRHRNRSASRHHHAEEHRYLPAADGPHRVFFRLEP